MNKNITNKIKALAVVFTASLVVSVSAQEKVSTIFRAADAQKKTIMPTRTARATSLDMSKQSGKHFFAPKKSLRKVEADGTEVLLEEDFSGMTKGTIDAQNSTDFISGYYVQDASGNQGTYWVYEGLTKKSGWSSFAGLQAGGAVGLTYPGFGGCINTPVGDYSGELTITYRVHIPTAGQSIKTNVLFCNVLKGAIAGPETAMSYSESINLKKYNKDMMDAEGWIYDTVQVANTYGGSDCFIQFNTQYDYIVLDNVKITAKSNILAAPTEFSFSDFKRDGFTATWNKIGKANQYSIDMFETYTKGEGGSYTEFVGKDFTAVTDTVLFNFNGGQLDSLKLNYMVVDSTAASPLAFEFYNGVEWQQLFYINPSYTDWHTFDMTEDVQNNAPLYKLRIVSYKSTFSGHVKFGTLSYTAGAPTFRKEACSGLVVKDTTYTFTELNPESDYFLSVTSRNTETGLVSSPSDYNLAFGISQPVAIAATDVDERGGYTANWERTPKASYYEVNNLAVLKMTEDKPAYTVIDEDFTGAKSQLDILNMTTISLDEYATNSSGWLGFLNQVDVSAVGGAYYYGAMGGTVATPEICLNNNDGTCNITVTAKGSDGDYLIMMNKAGYWCAMALTADYQTKTLQLDHCSDQDQITFESYYYKAFLIDKVKITQDLKAGDLFLKKCNTASPDGNETSMRFSGLDTDLTETYAYDVYAYYTRGGSICYSEKSNRIFVNLAAGIKGDVNGDGVVNSSDIAALVQMILNSGTDAAGDVNEDGAVNASDISALTTIILGV